MKKQFLIVIFALVTFVSTHAQEQIVFKQTFVKAKAGTNYGENLRTKFSKFAQMRIDKGLQSGWHLWAVVNNPQAPFTHLIVEPMTLSEMKKWEGTSWEERGKMRAESMPEMSQNDWEEFMENVADKREIVAVTFSAPVKDITRDGKVALPDKFGVVNFMKVVEGKAKTYETMESKLWSGGIPKNSKQTGWSLGKRIDKIGTEIYWNYWTVDWFSTYSDIIARNATSPAWDADKSYAQMLKIRDLKESVTIRRVMTLDK